MTSNSSSCQQSLQIANSVLWLIAVLTAAGPAQSAETPSAGNPSLFERLDVNHDDAITADEVSAENRPLFDRLVRRADSNHDRQLSKKEFSASLVPTRPEKEIEEKQSSMVPEANAVRYMLLTMDANKNARIEKDEVPRELKGAFENMTERMDKNGNGSLERQELSRGGPMMSAVAGRYVSRMGVDVDAALAKMKKADGESFDRFEQQPKPPEQLRDSKQSRQMFAQLDENGDGKLEAKEVPDPIRERIERLIRIADRDGDGKLTQDEFVAATEQLGKFLKRGGPEKMPFRERMRDRRPNGKSKPDESTSAKK